MTRLSQEFPYLYDRVQLLRDGRLQGAPMREEDYELIDLWDAVQAGQRPGVRPSPSPPKIGTRRGSVIVPLVCFAVVLAIIVLVFVFAFHGETA